MTNLEIIRQACVKANPEIVTQDIARKIGSTNVIFQRPIRLADVLLAIDEADAKRIERTNYCVTTTGAIATMGYVGRFYHQHTVWNLRADSLEEQSEETLQFLADLLK